MPTRTRPTHPFTGARRMPPTRQHRAAIWECMLGTVYSCNAEGKVKYFDYDWDGARAWAGVDAEGADPRVAKTRHAVAVGGETIGARRAVLYVRRVA